MDLQEVIKFLEEQQPMPNNPSEELLTRYKAVTEFLYNYPHKSCIPLLLGSFAEWDDWSVYDSVQTVLRLFPNEEVLPHLIHGLSSDNPSIRLWCADTARFFAHGTLVEPLGELLLRDDLADIRLIAATALEQIPLPEVAGLAKEAIERESDEEVIDVLIAIIEMAKGRKLSD